ncbi:LysR family transcriptional regulator [Pandoraea pulmonicola]|uniref:D-malate degradation protein R n=1 Tax=Pandoraea pulmonicola TaxID=93221 RepID=A0AAJ4ZF69_PANPU|nr:LysR family transcriptional regulator [Pandoraea pulmonicola]AJC19621.1 LysR family transcriptional regulator [Pandoraea pulmonicola]SUA92278.1 D-malate degradation protein R [Pandoraea pulmonicola]
MDRLTSMAVFVKAVDLGSFAAVADTLGLSGPMVGKHVHWLETRLGMRLLNRTTRRQSLTDFGRAYYERCKIVLAEAEAADALAADQLAEPRGKLRVAMPVHFGRRCVAPVLLRLAQRYPTLELDLSFSDRFVDLAEGDYDIAIRTGDLEDKAGIVARRVARQPMIVCASPAYVETHGLPHDIDALGVHQAVLYRRSGRARPWLFPRDGQPPHAFMPANRVRMDDLDAIADAATLGAGIAWLPYWLVSDRIRAGALVHLLPEQPPFLYDAYALWLQTPHLPRKVRIAVDALAEALPGMMT